MTGAGNIRFANYPYLRSSWHNAHPLDLHKSPKSECIKGFRKITVAATPAQILIDVLRPMSYTESNGLLDLLPTTLSTASVDRINFLLTI